MLTKTDFSQIRKIVQGETRKIVQDEISPLKTDVNHLKENVGSLKNDIVTIKQDVKILRRDTSKIRKDIGVIVSFFDREYLDLEKRVERIEDYLKLPPTPALSS